MSQTKAQLIDGKGSAAFDGDLTVDTNTLYVDSTNNRVGIGTTSPTSILSITGSSQITHTYTGATGGFAVGQFNASGDASVNNVANAPLLFATNNTERARIDSSGRLLVGTSTSTNNIRAAEKLAVVAAGSAVNGGIALSNYGGTNSGAYSLFDFQRSRGTTDGSMTSVASGDGLGAVVFRGADGTNFINAALIEAYVDGTPGANDMPGRLVFSTTADGASSPTERMRIGSNGKLLVAGTNDNGAYNIQCNGTGVWGFGAYVNGSDERLKENINPLPASLDVVKALNPVAFQYKPEFTADTSVQPGFIAQELQTALADQTYLEGVVQAGGQYLNVAYQALIPVLTKALQEAIAKIETLEAKVAALESV